MLKHMSKLYQSNLEERYGISHVDDENLVEALDEIAKKRGAIIRGGESDYDKVYKRVIKDILSKNIINTSYDYVIILRNGVLNLKYLNIKDELLKLLKGEN